MTSPMDSAWAQASSESSPGLWSLVSLWLPTETQSVFLLEETFLLTFKSPFAKAPPRTIYEACIKGRVKNSTKSIQYVKCYMWFTWQDFVTWLFSGKPWIFEALELWACWSLWRVSPWITSRKVNDALVWPWLKKSVDQFLQGVSH